MAAKHARVRLWWHPPFRLRCDKCRAMIAAGSLVLTVYYGQGGATTLSDYCPDCGEGFRQARLLEM